MIKNIEELKNIQIVCKNREQIKNCLNYLEQLGFDIDDFSAYYYDGYNIIFWEERDERFIISNKLKENLKIEFYNKKLIKTLQKFIKKEEEVKDFEVAEDGRITKINNRESKKNIYFLDNYNKEYFFSNKENVDYCIDCGLVFETEQARDKAMFKSKIETELKNIAERLNAGRKIEWEDENQSKFIILYNYKSKILSLLDLYGVYRWKYQGGIYCLDKNFLEVAKQEIGEDNLIKYFKE